MIATAYAKVNIALKITGTRGNYHEIFSRFMLAKHLKDTIAFIPKNTQGFSIEGDFDCTLEKNTLYKAYMALKKVGNSKKIEDFFATHSVRVDKNIPAYAGLGGGSSDAATFLTMTNRHLNLSLSDEILMQIGLKIGADVPFFLSGFHSANVYGIGEIITPFEEELLHFESYTPDIKISTPKVYQGYRDAFFNPISATEVNYLEHLDAHTMLETLSITEANDLYMPACKLYDTLSHYAKEGYHFSGSGSTFFKEREDG